MTPVTHVTRPAFRATCASTWVASWFSWIAATYWATRCENDLIWAEINIWSFQSIWSHWFHMISTLAFCSLDLIDIFLIYDIYIYVSDISGWCLRRFQKVLAALPSVSSLSWRHLARQLQLPLAAAFQRRVWHLRIDDKEQTTALQLFSLPHAIAMTAMTAMTGILFLWVLNSFDVTFEREMATNIFSRGQHSKWGNQKICKLNWVKPSRTY